MSQTTHSHLSFAELPEEWVNVTDPIDFWTRLEFGAAILATHPVIPAPTAGIPTAEGFAPASVSSETASDSSASSPLSSASPGQEVPNPAGSPHHDMLEVFEMVTANSHASLATPNSPTTSKKRKATESAASKEVTKAAAPAPYMSKRARANERTRKREAHSQAERERRDELKEEFATMRQVLPTDLCPDRKSQVDLLRAANTYIVRLQRDQERAAKEKAEMSKELETLRAQLAAIAAAASALAPRPF